MSPIQVQMMALRRQSFSGRTDKYAVGRPSPSPVVDTVRRDLGFIDVTNGQFSDFYRETAIDRLNGYKKALDFYSGDHWKAPTDNGEVKPVNNFCSTIVNKTLDFMYGAGLGFVAAPGNELLASLIDSIWTANQKNLLYQELCMMGSVLGDCFVFVTLTPDDKIRLVSINPQFCFPMFERDSNTIKAVMIQYPGDSMGPTGVPIINTLYITPSEFVLYSDLNEVPETRKPNPFGFVPLVHIPNSAIPGKLFGRSDLKDVIPLNEEYNTTMYRMRRIISYHAEPTTVIFGAKASKLEKGANKVWSGLPTDAKVENLQLNTDLSAIQAYMDKVEKAICRISDMPRCVFDTDMAISNTSGIAIRLMYKPLLDKVGRKRVPYGEGITRVNDMIVKIIRIRKPGMVEALLDDQKNVTVRPLFTDSLPENTNEILDAEIKKLSNNLTSRAESFRTVNAAKDMTRIAGEIVMDMRAQLAMDREKAVALLGGSPNLNAPFLGSIPANEDFESISEEASTDAESAAEDAKDGEEVSADNTQQQTTS